MVVDPLKCDAPSIHSGEQELSQAMEFEGLEVGDPMQSSRNILQGIRVDCQSIPPSILRPPITFPSREFSLIISTFRIKKFYVEFYVESDPSGRNALALILHYLICS